MAVTRTLPFSFLSFPENVLNKHTFGTMALEGEKKSFARHQTLLVTVQHSVRKTPESRVPENQTRPHIWPMDHFHNLVMCEWRETSGRKNSARVTFPA